MFDVNSHHRLHHIGLVVPQCFNGVENIHDILLLDHLIDAADGTECSGAPPTSTAEEEEGTHETSSSTRVSQ